MMLIYLSSVLTFKIWLSVQGVLRYFREKTLFLLKLIVLVISYLIENISETIHVTIHFDEGISLEILKCNNFNDFKYMSHFLTLLVKSYFYLLLNHLLCAMHYYM